MKLSPADPGSWAQYPFDDLFAIPRSEFEPIQLEAMRHRFEQLRSTVVALDRRRRRAGFEQMIIDDEARHHRQHR